jgi:hypothetical protein
MVYYIKNLKYLFVPICACHMYAVGYEVYQHPPSLLIGLHSVACKCQLINFNQYDLRVYIRIFCDHVLFCTPFPVR